MSFLNETAEEREARIAAYHDDLRRRLEGSPEIKQLRASGQFDKALELLGNRKRKARKRWEPKEFPLDLWMFQAVQQCLSEPDLAETMTAKERREHAAAIEHHCESLWTLIEPFWDSTRGMAWPFQPYLDSLALDLSIDYTKDFDLPAEELEEAQHRSRFGIYYLLMHRLEDVLATLVQCGDDFAETETVIKKPNDRNAKRLYFLRIMTKRLCGEFGSPCRGVALALASAFFDCSDLDEASVSKLAPVIKPVPVEIPVEQLTAIAAMCEEQLAKLPDAESEKAEELKDHLNFYRRLIAEHSG